LHGHKNDSGLLRRPGDGMCLSTPGRAIREDGRIVAVQDGIEQGFRGGFVDVGLGRVFVEDAIEGECLVFGSLAGWNDGAAESLDGVVLGGVKDPVGCTSGDKSVVDDREPLMGTHKHFSSTTLMTLRRPF
jgi:hypothetical protein